MLKVSSHLKANVEEEMECNNVNDYKGMYYNDNHEQRYYEGGAHFRYKDLCSRLEKIVLSLTPDRRGKSMYQDWSKEKDKNKEISIKKKLEEYNTSFLKTKANSRKIASDSSKETLIEKTSSSKIMRTIKSGNSYGSALDAMTTMTNNPIIPLNKSNHAQSRNHSLNANHTNNFKNSYVHDSGLKQQQSINVMRTFSGGQHIKSNSMTIASNLSNQNNSNNTNQIISNLNNATGNQAGNTTQNIQINYKKVQPKIIKNNNNTTIHGKLPSNYVEILNKRKTENSRNNYLLGSDFMRVGNNTKNNISNMTRTKFLNSSAMLNGTANATTMGINNLNNSNLHEKERGNSQNKEIRVVTTQSVMQQHGQNNSNSQIMPINNININMNITNTHAHSRNYKKNEISTLSDLTNSMNRGPSIEETKRKSNTTTTNLIVKPKINISFVNNVNNIMGSLESINNTININHSQNYIEPSGGIVNNKKSRNDKVDIFLKNNTNNTNKTVKSAKINNFKSMITGIHNVNNKTKSRNIKTQYSINFDTLSKGNTIEKDKEGDLVTGASASEQKKTNSKIGIEGKKLVRNTYDNINYTNLSAKKSPVQIQNRYNNSVGIGPSNNHFQSNVNTIISKEKDLSILASNCMFLKQKINNLKIGLNNSSKPGKLKFNFIGVKTTSIGFGNNSSNNNSVNNNSAILNKPNKFLMNTKAAQNISAINETSSSLLINKNNNLKINSSNNTSYISRPKINK